MAARAGADALCVQGYEAGAHRGTFVNDDEPGRDRGLLSLIGEVAAVTGLPQIAAGGIMDARQVRAVLAAGAVAAQCGTAFLRSPESGAHPLHKAALADPRYAATTSPGPLAGRRPAGWSTSSSSTTPTLRPPTPKSTTRPARCAPRPPPAATPSGCPVGGTGLPVGGRAARGRDHRPALSMIIRLASAAEVRRLAASGRGSGVAGIRSGGLSLTATWEKRRHASEGSAVR